MRSGFGFIFPSPQVRTVGMGRSLGGAGVGAKRGGGMGGWTDEREQSDEGDELTGGSIYR